MLEMVAQVAVSALFYDLLKPVNRSLARISAIIGLTGCGIKTMARLFYYAPLILLGGASYLSAIQPAQLEALSLAFIKINNQGAAIALIFFGFETLLRGWLLFKSGFLPRFLGVLVHGRRPWLAHLSLAAARLPGVHRGRALRDRRSDRNDRMALHPRCGRREVESARRAGGNVDLAVK